MNLSLKTLTLSLATSAVIAFGQDAPLDNPNPAAAVEKAKEVVAAVQDVNNAAAEALPAAAAVEDVEGAKDVQDVPDVQDVQDVQDAPATGDDELEGVTVTSGDDPNKITVSLDAVELEDVVRLFTRLSGANIICNTTNLHGTVTANLVDIRWRDALTHILAGQGLQLREEPPESDIFIIAPKTPKEPKPWDNWITEVFKLNFVKTADASRLLESFLGVQTAIQRTTANASGKDARAVPLANNRNAGTKYNSNEEVVTAAVYSNGRVVSYPAGNTLVVSADPETMREVKKVMKELDVPRKQIYIEAKIVQVSGEASKKVGIDWSFLNGYTISAGPFDRNYTKLKTRDKTDSYFFQANEGTHNRWYASDDGYTIMDKIPNAAVARGGEGDNIINPPTYIYRDRTDSIEHDKMGAWSSTSRTKGALGDSLVTDVQTAIFNADALKVVMSALETSDDVAQISNPKLIVANEERAVIDMTQKIPYVTIDMKQDGTGSESTYSYTTKLENIPLPKGKDKNDDNIPTPAYIDGAFFSSGIRVDVTPRINNSSNITVVIEPMLSHVDHYYSPAGENGTQYPVLNIRNVNTTFSLGDGQTAVIGGLTQTEDYDTVKKIPLLGDIPLIGKYLFSWSSKQKKQTEIIIFVTVGIVDPEKKETMMSYPDGARLVQKRIDNNGKIIDKRFKDMETKEQAQEADLKEAEAQGLVVPEVVEE